MTVTYGDEPCFLRTALRAVRAMQTDRLHARVQSVGRGGDSPYAAENGTTWAKKLDISLRGGGILLVDFVV